MSAALPAPATDLEAALHLADTKGGTADEVVTRAKKYALFLQGAWQRVGVTVIAVTAPGENYSSAPTVELTSPTGSGAEAVATVTNGKLASIAVTKSGVGYAEPPTVTFTGGGGTGAAAVATLAEPA